MDREPVSSSNLASVGYDLDSATLEVAFLNGRVYQYQGVPEEIHLGLMSAGSKGSYFNEYVKRAGYPYIQVG